MNKNTIVERVADFLKEYPPFNLISPKELTHIASQVEVFYLPKMETLFKAEQVTKAFFYVVQQGAISLYTEEQSLLVDVCQPGDLLGLRPLFADNKYALKAIAQKDSLVYAVPIASFKPVLTNNFKALHYLLEVFAANSKRPNESISDKEKLPEARVFEESDALKLSYFQHISYTKHPVTAPPDEKIKEVALLMRKHKISSVIIVQNELPIGIVTDKDLRNKVATGEVSLSEETKQIMSSPVVCSEGSVNVAELQLLMLKNNIGHVCITEDGSPRTKLLGIMSEHDIIAAQANNPVALLKRVMRSKDVNELNHIRFRLGLLIESFLSAKLPLAYLMKVAGEINSSLTKRCVELAKAELGEAPCSFAWMNLGSQGRGEQLLLTDQDNALVFEEVGEDEKDGVQAYFLDLAELVTKYMNQIGYDFCPAAMMASNPKWCLSLNQWKQQFTSWIKKPSEERIMMCTIFFDFQFIEGDQKLTQSLNQHIYKMLSGDQSFFAHLGLNAIKNPPPLGIFKQILVEEEGRKKGLFDVKSRALMPLVDAARILLLSKQNTTLNNTAERFLFLAKDEPQNADLFERCAQSFLLFSKHRTQAGINEQDSGRFVDLEKMSKQERVALKNAFQPISEIQSVLKNRFKLTYFT